MYIHYHIYIYIYICIYIYINNREGKALKTGFHHFIHRYCIGDRHTRMREEQMCRGLFKRKPCKSGPSCHNCFHGRRCLYADDDDDDGELDRELTEEYEDIRFRVFTAMAADDWALPRDIHNEIKDPNDDDLEPRVRLEAKRMPRPHLRKHDNSRSPRSSAEPDRGSKEN